MNPEVMETTAIEYSEIIEVSTFIQNTGKSKAEDVQATVEIENENIFLLSENSNFSLGTMNSGEYKEIKFVFTVNKRFDEDNLPIKLKISELTGDYGESFDLGLKMNRTTVASRDFKISPLAVENNRNLENSKILTIDIHEEIPEAGEENRDAIAVVMGNSFYKKTKNVDFAINDALAMRTYLIKTLGYKDGNIFYIENATQSDFMTYFGVKGNYKGKLFNAVKKNKSDVFIYYSGHGAPGLKDQKGYFVPVECDPQYVELGGYPLETFYENLAEIPAKSFTVILDACFSGADIFENISPIVIQVKNPVMKLNHGIVLASSSGNQVSSWYNEKQHGMFTYFFLKGIHNKNGDLNKDGQLTYEELYKFISDESEGVPYYARRLHGVEQNPTLQGNESKRVFVKY